MAIAEDLARVIHQEAELRLPRFDNDDAWKLGVLLRDLAISRNYTLVIDVRRFGQPPQPLFYAALPGTTGGYQPRWPGVLAGYDQSSPRRRARILRSGSEAFFMIT